MTNFYAFDRFHLAVHDTTNYSYGKRHSIFDTAANSLRKSSEHAHDSRRYNDEGRFPPSLGRNTGRLRMRLRINLLMCLVYAVIMSGERSIRMRIRVGSQTGLGHCDWAAPNHDGGHKQEKRTLEAHGEVVSRLTAGRLGKGVVEVVSSRMLI